MGKDKKGKTASQCTTCGVHKTCQGTGQCPINN